jgi:hypothetical protein
VKKVNLFLILFFIVTSCYKNYLYVHHEKMDSSYLASTHIGTPDPRQKHPPEGQRISISWDFPLSIYRENLTLVTTIRFWDNRQEVFSQKVTRKRGYISYKFQDDTENKVNKILTYKIEVFNEDGKLIDQWKHQFWKELIKINKEEDINIIDEGELF